VLRSRIAPPPLPLNHIARPELLARLADAARQRVTLVLAGPGYGKTTLLAAYAATHGCAWLSLEREDVELASFIPGLLGAIRQALPGVGMPDGLGPQASEANLAEGVAAAVLEALDAGGENLVLVLDDLHELPAESPPARLVETLCRQAPPNLHLVLASRTEPPFPVARLRGRGQLGQLDGSLLAFQRKETEALVAASVVAGGGALAGELHELTGGWPAALCLAIDIVNRAPDGTAGLGLARHANGTLAGYLAEEVLDRGESRLRELIGTLAPVRRFTAGLCQAVGLAVTESDLYGWARRGLLLGPSGDPEPVFRIPPALVAAQGDRPGSHPLTPAVGWLIEHGWLAEALDILRTGGDPDRLAGFLRAQGDRMLLAGQVGGIRSAVDELPEPLHTKDINLLSGQANQILGDWDAALTAFRRAAHGQDVLPPGLAWRLGLIHYFRGELAEALDVLERAGLGGAEPADEALVLSWTASVHWLRRDHAACRQAAESALRLAVHCGHDGALAAAHTTRAMAAAMDGDRAGSAAHYGHARTAAQRGGDVLALLRIGNNLGSRRLEEGRFTEALAEFERVITLAEMTGYASLHALALHNRGEARCGLGHLEPAAADFTAALEIYRTLGSRMASYPLLRLGEVHRLRGSGPAATTCYEQGLAEAQRADDVQGIVPALAGLARTIVDTDPNRAAALAARAVGYGVGTSQVEALLAAGWVALATGDEPAAREWADRAGAQARSRGNQRALAEALELGALTGDRSRLTEAAELRRTVGDEVGLATNELLAAHLTGRPTTTAEHRLRELGVRLDTTHPAGALRCVLPPSVPVRVLALGAFHVLRDGHPLGEDDWRSRKARDLLKILISRRGRRTPREVLAEALWPGEDPVALGNRLSVALSTLRAVLDPDRRQPADRYLTAGKGTIGLAGLPVDVHEFIATARCGLDARAAGDSHRARALLQDAESRYTGDFLEEDPYHDWAVPLREEARSVYFAVTRALVDLAAELGDAELGARYTLRLLEHDPYDEGAHLRLIWLLSEAGRHGEARRHYRTYQSRMAELGMEPASMPTVSSRFKVG
jgi:DNA-binding SARP family transcriptional activator/tetratricopeptide (TPR) repeat protein